MSDLTPPSEEAPKGKKAKSQKAPKAPKAPKEPKAEGAGTGSSNPRPRKWNYGISNEATLKLIVEDTPRKGRDFKNLDKVVDGMTCEEFFAAGGDRHDLRVLSRGKAISIIGTDGAVYPTEYIGSAPEAEAASA